MKRHLTLGIVVAGLLLTAGPVLAQRPEAGGSRGGGDRASAPSGGGGGAAVSAAAGGGNIASSGGSVSSSAASGGSSSSASSPSATTFLSPTVSGGDRNFRAIAPEHRLAYSTAQARTRTAQSGDRSVSPRSGGNAASGGGAPAERAVPRGETRAPASSGTAPRRGSEAAPSNNSNGTSEVPNWSRPRGNRPASGSAVNRVGPRPGNGGGDDNCRDCGGYYGGGYYDPFYYGGFGYGLGYYDNFYGYPFYAPFGFGYGIPSGYVDPFYGDPYDYGGGYGAYSSRVYGGQDQGAMKLKVKPRNAKVYVDGYYVGLVDEFDGAFQKLTLNGGRHKVQLRADGYETTEFDVLVTPEQTVTFAGDMKKVQ